MQIEAKTTELIATMKRLRIINSVDLTDHSYSFDLSQRDFPAKHGLIWELISQSDRCCRFDAESSRIPPDYVNLVTAILHQFTPKEHYAINFDCKKTPQGLKDLQLKISRGATTLDFELVDYGDYYDHNGIRHALDSAFTFEDNCSIYEINTDDQSFCFMLLNVNQIEELYLEYNLEWDINYFTKFVTGQWNACLFPADNGLEERPLTIAEYYSAQSTKEDLDPRKLLELCESLKDSGNDETQAFYKDVFTSKYLESSKYCAKLLMQQYGFKSDDIFDSVIQGIEDDNSVYAIGTYLHYASEWWLRILPNLSRWESILDNFERQNCQVKQDPLLWSIVLLAYKQKSTYKFSRRKLLTSKNPQIKVIAAGVISFSPLVLNFLFPRRRLKEISNDLIIYITTEGRGKSIRYTYPFLKYLATENESTLLLDFFEKTRQHIDILDVMLFLSLFNMMAYRHSHAAVYTDLYLQLWDEDIIYHNKLIPILQLSERIDVKELVSNYQQNNPVSDQKNESYSIATANTLHTEIMTSFNSFLKIIEEKNKYT